MNGENIELCTIIRAGSVVTKNTHFVVIAADYPCKIIDILMWKISKWFY